VQSTVLFVTHNQVEAMTMADRIVIMKDGHIQQVGTPADVYHSPANAFVARFIGSPSMNMVETEVRDATAQLAGRGVALGARAQGQARVTLGIRPDDLRVVESGGLMEGRVQVREPLGHETLIYVETPHGEVIAKADGRTPPDVGALVHLQAAPETIHVFDPQSGAAL